MCFNTEYSAQEEAEGAVLLRDMRPFVRYVRTLTIREGEFPDYMTPYDCRLVYAMESGGRIDFESSGHALRKGALLIWPAGMKYRYVIPHGGGMTLFAVNFDLDARGEPPAFPIPPVRAETFCPERMIAAPGCAELPMTDAPLALSDAYFCERLLHDMLEEYERQRLFMQETLCAMMARLLFSVARQRVQSEGGALIDQILGYIHSHYAENLTNIHLGEVFGFHPNSLNRLIVRQTGQTLHQYLLMYRLRQAMPLIESGAEPIAAIAARVGFSDPGYFSKLFRSKIGCSPVEYRKG